MNMGLSSVSHFNTDLASDVNCFNHTSLSHLEDFFDSQTVMCLTTFGWGIAEEIYPQVTKPPRITDRG